MSTAVSGGTDLKGAARNGMLALLGSAIAAVAGLALNVVIGRGLGASASGIFFVVVAVLTVVSTITKLGADTGLVWAISRARALGREGDVRQFVTTAIWPAVVAGTLCGAVIFALAEPLAGLLTGSGGDPQVVARTAEQTEHLLRLAAPFLIVAAPCFVLAAGVRGTGDIVGYTGVQNILVPGLRPLLAGAGIAAGLGLSAAVLTWNVTFVLGTAVAAWLVVRRTRELELAHPGAERRPKAEISSTDTTFELSNRPPSSVSRPITDPLSGPRIRSRTSPTRVPSSKARIGLPITLLPLRIPLSPQMFGAITKRYAATTIRISSSTPRARYMPRRSGCPCRRTAGPPSGGRSCSGWPNGHCSGMPPERCPGTPRLQPPHRRDIGG